MRVTSLVLYASLALVLVAPTSAARVGHELSPHKAGIQDLLSDLEDLEFDEFLDASYIQILLRSPQLVTGMGLSEMLGVGDGELDNLCYSYVDETYELKAGIREILNTYQRSELDEEQQISFDSYSWLLSAWAEERRFMYHFYPVTPRFSRQIDLLRLFANEHPLETRRNAEDYVSRLEQVDDQIACLLQNLEDSEDLGIVAPADLLWHAADELRFIAPGTATELPFYTSLADKIEEIDELTPAQRLELLWDAYDAINTSVIPGYQALIAELDEQKHRAPPMNGVWQLPDGDAFYASRLRHHTTTELSPEEVHQLGLNEVARLQNEIRAACDLLGYPADEGLEELMFRVAVDSGIVPGDQYRAVTEEIVRQAEENIVEAFDIAPETEVIVITGQGGMFYVPGSLDGSRPGAYYAGSERDAYRFWMQSTAYHEAVPGHHFQISIGNELDLPLFTKDGGFYTAYVEGWALYAEYLAGELGWYDDVYCELGQLHAELMRAARLVLDTGIHQRRWTHQQALEYFANEVGSSLQGAYGQVELYTFFPGYFSSYKTGMWKILELRQRAMDELGDGFDIKAFHRAVLSHNRLPLSLLEELIDDYVADELARATPRRAGGRLSPAP
jgi:uncharacterized protein (DUF885 family)